MLACNPRSIAQIAEHSMLIQFSVAFLVATLVCDLIFWGTGNPAWNVESLYLLGAAPVMGMLLPSSAFRTSRSNSRLPELFGIGETGGQTHG